MQINLSGLASGFDWTSFVNQMVAAEQTAETPYKNQQSTITQQQSAYSSLKTELTNLGNALSDLGKISFFGTQTASSSNSSVGTATSAGGATIGRHTFNVSQLATASTVQSAAKLGGTLNSSSDVSNLFLNTAPFAAAVTAGTITVNGQKINIATTDTLQNVFDNISTATGGAVTASYDPTADTITLSSSGTISLGAANDSSNFLQVAKLQNNDTGTVTSTSALGSMQAGRSLATADLATAISDGGGGSGSFSINGVAISFSAADDSLNNIIDRINNSSAGVTASFDSINNRLVLANNSTGNLDIALQDNTGNFLAATGLLGATVQRGSNLVYSIDGGTQITSQNNTIGPDSSGLAGLTVTALDTGSFTVSVASDTSTIKEAITAFIAEYNKVQSLITTDTASTTDSSGKVSTGVLSNEHQPDEFSSQLRNLVDSILSASSTGSIKSLDDLGITSNGYDNTLTVSDSTKLDSALANHLSGVQSLFTDATGGIATQISAYVTRITSADGALTSRQTDLSALYKSLTDQIARMDANITADKNRMVTEFTNMEKAQAKINQELTYLTQAFGGSSSSSSSSSSGASKTSSSG